MIEYEEDVSCPKCGSVTHIDNYYQPSFCSKCGTNIEDKYLSFNNYCPKCSPDGPSCLDDELAIDDKYCPMCGGETINYEKLVSREM